MSVPAGVIVSHLASLVVSVWREGARTLLTVGEGCEKEQSREGCRGDKVDPWGWWWWWLAGMGANE